MSRLNERPSIKRPTVDHTGSVRELSPVVRFVLGYKVPLTATSGARPDSGVGVGKMSQNGRSGADAAALSCGPLIITCQNLQELYNGRKTCCVFPWLMQSNYAWILMASYGTRCTRSGSPWFTQGQRASASRCGILEDFSQAPVYPDHPWEWTTYLHRVGVIFMGYMIINV